MRYFIFIITFTLFFFTNAKSTTNNFQECTVSLVSQLKYRPALGLLSKSCYFKYGSHQLGDKARKTGACIIDKIVSINSINQGKELIDMCAKPNNQLNIFLKNILDDD